MRSRAVTTPPAELEQLALRHEASLPPAGEGERPAPVDWQAQFGRAAARRIEIGSGNGIFIASEAAACPGVDFLAIEREPEFYWKMARRIDDAGLTNVKTTRFDAWDVLDRIPDGSVERVYCYFTDPWPKRRHAGNRVVRPQLLPVLERLLAPGGEFWFRTDVAWLFNLTVTLWRARAEREGQPWRFIERAPLPPPVDDPARAVTNFERKGREAGRQPWAFSARWQ